MTRRFRSSRERQLIEAILANPDSDIDRSSYAEWLDSVDDPRGRFVWRQLELATMHRRGAPPSVWGAAYDEQAALLKAGRNLWLEPIEELIEHGSVSEPMFHRGCIEHVTMTASDFLSSFSQVTALVPIRHLHLTELRGHAKPVFADKRLARIRALDISGNDLTDDDVSLLATSRHVNGVSWLDLSRNRIARAGLEHIAASKALPNLMYLALWGNDVEDPTDHAAGEEGHLDYQHPTELGSELEKRHGRLEWLHSNTRWAAAWPPNCEATEP